MGFFFMSHPDRNYFEPAYCTDLCCDLDIEMSMVYGKYIQELRSEGTRSSLQCKSYFKKYWDDP